MVETSEISVQTDDKFKTPLYVREHAKKYRDNNREKHKQRVLKYKSQMIENNSEEYANRIKQINKRYYKKKREVGITPEEKAKKAEYMRQYRARKKQEKLNSNA